MVKRLKESQGHALTAVTVQILLSLAKADQHGYGIKLDVEERTGGAVNLGSGAEISIKDLVRLIAQLTGFKGEIVWDTSKPDGQPRRGLDTSRAEESFGFRASVDFEEGLKRTIKWYLQDRISASISN